MLDDQTYEVEGSIHTRDVVLQTDQSVKVHCEQSPEGRAPLGTKDGVSYLGGELRRYHAHKHQQCFLALNEQSMWARRDIIDLKL